MNLSEKGRYAPPPQLKPSAQHVSETIAKWTGIHARTHWLLGDERRIDGADFYFGEDELGHIHLDSQAHVMHARPVAEALIKSGLGRRFSWSGEVVVFDIRKQTDAAHALWLFELSYDRCRGAKSTDLLGRVSQYVEGVVARSERRAPYQSQRPGPLSLKP